MVFPNGIEVKGTFVGEINPTVCQNVNMPMECMSAAMPTLYGAKILEALRVSFLGTSSSLCRLAEGA